MISERIKEIAARARRETNDEQNFLERINNCELTAAERIDIYNKNFAEAIIAHTTDCVRDVLREPGGGLTSDAATKVQSRIKEFFGVKW